MSEPRPPWHGGPPPWMRRGGPPPWMRRGGVPPWVSRGARRPAWGRRERDPGHEDPDQGGVGPWNRAQWGRRRPAGIVLFLAFVQVAGTRAFAYGAGGRHLDALAYLLLVAGPAALVLRGRWAPLSLVATLATTGAYFALGYPAGPVFLAALVAVFSALRTKQRILTWVLTGLAYAAASWHSIHGKTHDVRGVIVVGVWCAVVLGLAEAARVRTGRYAEIVRARAQEQERAAAEAEKAAREADKAAKEAQRASAEQERRQASEERLQIARELHDVLGHHLSLINVQAGVGLHLMDERPEQARAALAAIKHASAEALRETRAVLAALNPRSHTAAPRAPTPGLRDLGALVTEVTAAGLPVTVEVDGDERALPAEVDRAAYRIVQEALTNVRRHAGPSASAGIFIVYRPRAVDVRIADDGGGESAGDPQSGPQPQHGSGIAGMRERASALGGSVEAGPRAGGGFEVRAHLPHTTRTDAGESTAAGTDPTSTV